MSRLDRWQPIEQHNHRPKPGRLAAGEAIIRRALPLARVWQNRSDQTCRIEETEVLAALWRQAGGRIDVNALDGEGHTAYGQEPIASQVAAFLASSARK